MKSTLVTFVCFIVIYYFRELKINTLKWIFFHLQPEVGIRKTGVEPENVIACIVIRVKTLCVSKYRISKTEYSNAVWTPLWVSGYFYYGVFWKHESKGILFQVWKFCNDV